MQAWWTTSGIRHWETKTFTTSSAQPHAQLLMQSLPSPRSTHQHTSQRWGDLRKVSRTSHQPTALSCTQSLSVAWSDSPSDTTRATRFSLKLRWICPRTLKKLSTPRNLCEASTRSTSHMHLCTWSAAAKFSTKAILPSHRLISIPSH